MVINKYLKTDSQVVIIGKMPKAGGTPLLTRLEELINKEPALAVRFNLDSWAVEKTTIAYLRGMVEGVSMAVKEGVEVVVLLDEVTRLSSELSAMLLDAIKSWIEDSNISVVCTGHESTIIDMFESVTGNEYFNLESYSSGHYNLVHETGEIISVKK